MVGAVSISRSVPCPPPSRATPPTPPSLPPPPPLSLSLLRWLPAPFTALDPLAVALAVGEDRQPDSAPVWAVVCTRRDRRELRRAPWACGE